MKFAAKLRAPFGMLGIRTEGGVLTEIVFLEETDEPLAPQDAVAKQACDELLAYFADADHAIMVPFVLKGTPHRQRVWERIARIPRGKTASYGEIAIELGSSPRAVGGACGANPLPLLIPCHRVVGKKGIGGFMHRRDDASLAIKRWLIRHESA